MTPRPYVRALAFTLCLAGAGAVELEGQGFRGSATTTARYIELRPIRQDTVSRSRVTEGADGRLTFDGIPVSCVEGLGCVFYRSTEVQHAIAATQDVQFTAWGLGVQGLSVTSMLRARLDAGGDFVWPRSDDHFDAILAYAELNRGIVRARLGRQRNLSGLGFSGYDGASVLAEPRDWIGIEGYAGRSLARGLNEPRSGALVGVEDFVIDRDAWLYGAAARLEPLDNVRMNLRYQRELWAGRSGLVSERASFDVATSQFRPLIADAAIDYDFGFGRIGKAHATVRAAAPFIGGVTLEATARRYLPYYELWTIWGFFSPVAYHEAELRGSWLASDRLGAWLSGGWRRYEEANATVILRPLEQQGIRVTAGARWQPADALQTTFSYRLERGFGAFLSSGDASVEWRPTPRLALSFDGTAFQQIEQFRVGEGIVWGGGPAVDAELRSGLTLSAGASLYRQTFENRPGIANWNQVRAWTALRAGFGRDPGVRRVPTP
jgi:hypothetical protein